MKHFALLNAITLSCGVALAAPHDYQLQIGSSELDPSIWEGAEPTWQAVERSRRMDSRSALYRSANVDGDQPFHFVGRIVPSGPTRVPLYEVYRDSPEGTAYRDYFERFPADTDWKAIAESRKHGDGDV